MHIYKSRYMAAILKMSRKVRLLNLGSLNVGEYIAGNVYTFALHFDLYIAVCKHQSITMIVCSKYKACKALRYVKYNASGYNDVIKR